MTNMNLDPAIDLASVNWYAMIVPVIIAIILSALPWTRKHMVSPYITVIHEYGHAVANILTLGRPHGIKARFAHGGGETRSMRPKGFLSGIGAIISALSGYPAPIILGLALVISVFGDWSDIMVLTATILFTVFIFLMRNLSGILLAILTAGYFAVATTYPHLEESMALAAGMVLIVGGVMDVLRLIGYWVQGQAGETDLGILQSNFFLPQIIWLVLMLAGTLAAIVLLVFLSLAG
jgi:hypothetical protein